MELALQTAELDILVQMEYVQLVMPVVKPVQEHKKLNV
jgi:hypothetical protein